MSSILITGGAGFIGSHLARYFVHQGYDVTIADRFTYAGKGRNLQDILPQVHLLIGDLSTGDLAERCAALTPEYVVHMAANTHVDRAIADPESFMWSNVIGTTRLLQAFWLAAHATWESTLAAHGFPRKIIVYSTDEVFGPTPAGCAFDESAPFRPSNAYSASKVGVEGVASSFYVTHRMPLVVVRPCNTYGYGQHPEKVIPRFVSQMLQGQPVTVYNDGTGSRDWLHTLDHARAIECLLMQGEPGQSYNLGAGEEHSDLDICGWIATILGEEGLLPSAPDITFVPGRPGHDRRYFMVNAKLRSLGWSPRVDFAQGLRETVLWNAMHQDYWSDDRVRPLPLAAY